MEALTLVEKAETKLSELGLPSDIRGGIIASLEQRKDQKLKKYRTDSYSEYLAELLRFDISDKILFIIVISMACSVPPLVVALIISTMTFYIFVIGFGWSFLALILFSGFFLYKHRTKMLEKNTKSIQRIENKCQQISQRLYTDPVSFLSQSIRYCRDHVKKYSQEIIRIDAEFKIAVTDPREYYQQTKDQAVADLKRLRNTPDSELLGIDGIIRARESRIEFCDNRLQQIEPQELEITAQIEKVKSKANLIAKGITELINLKTQFESLEAILQRSREDMDPESFAETVEVRRTRALADIETRLMTLEEDMNYTANGIKQIFQTIPEPDQFGMNRPIFQLAVKAA